MKKQLLVILSVILILMAGFGIGVVAAEDSATDAGSDNSVSDTSSDTSSDSGSDTSSDNSVSDSSSDTDDGSSTDDSSSDTDDGSSTDDSSSDADDSSATDDTSSDDSPSTDDSTSESDNSVDDSTTDESGNVDDTDTEYSTDDELELESGAITADESDNVDDIDITDESEYPVDDRSDYLVNESEYMVVDDFDDNITDDNITLQHGGVPPRFINDTDISSDDDHNYSSDDNTTTANNNSTVNIGNTVINDNSTTIIKYIEKTYINIDNSQNVYYNVVNDNSVVNNIYFTPTKSSGKAKIVVEDLKNDKCLKVKPAGKIYKIFNIRIDNKDAANNMKNAGVDFKVEKSWLKANGLDKSSIVLNMYDNGKWIEVPITITSEDSKYIYFKAEVSRYSTFAITGKTVVVDKVTKQSDSQNNGNSDEEIDGTTKNVVIKLLELIIDLLKE